jgi:DegV family protein with EDD domain
LKLQQKIKQYPKPTIGRKRKGFFMRITRIVADSSSDTLTLDGVNYSSAPLKIVAATREFVDDIELDVHLMSEFMKSYKGKSHTSCPNTNDWLDAFGGADDVICVTITSGLSGSYNSACTAAKIYEAEREGSRVFVLDSLSTGPEIALILRKLAEMVRAGTDYDAMIEKIKKYRERTGLYFMLSSLRTLANNGRVSPIVAKIVEIAGMRIVAKASDVGTIETKHKCRGESRAIDTLVKSMIEEGYRGGRIVIGHAENPSGAELAKSKILTVYPGADIYIHELRGLCSFYAERGGILIGFEKGCMAPMAQ